MENNFRALLFSPGFSTFLCAHYVKSFPYDVTEEPTPECAENIEGDGSSRGIGFSLCGVSACKNETSTLFLQRWQDETRTG
jgi:hypothetical protein